MFQYRIISDGPHRPDKIYLVAGPSLFSSGQVNFGERVAPTSDPAGTSVDEELPPLQFVFQAGASPKDA
jgi:hypothetical protein